MHKRNGTSYALGLRLWEIYNRRLLAETSPSERVIAHYQTFFEEPEAELRKIATFVGLDGNEIADAAALVAVNRRHTAFTIEQMIDAGVSGQIVALYRSLIDGTGERGKATREKKRSTKVEGDQLSGTENKLNPSIPDGEDVRRELAVRRGDEVRHREEVARLQQTIDRLREELAVKSVSAAAEINRRDGRIEELQKAYAHIDQLLKGEQVQRNQLFAELESRRNWTHAASKLRLLASKLKLLTSKLRLLTSKLRLLASKLRLLAAKLRWIVGNLNGTSRRSLSCANASPNPTNSCKRPVSVWPISKRGTRRSRNGCARSFWK